MVSILARSQRCSKVSRTLCNYLCVNHLRWISGVLACLLQVYRSTPGNTHWIIKLAPFQVRGNYTFELRTATPRGLRKSCRGMQYLSWTLGHLILNCGRTSSCFWSRTIVAIRLPLIRWRTYCGIRYWIESYMFRAADHWKLFFLL